MSVPGPVPPVPPPAGEPHPTHVDPREARRARRLERRRRRRERRQGCWDVANVCSCGGECLSLPLIGLYAVALVRPVRDRAPAHLGAVGRWLWRRVRAYQRHVSAHRPPCCPMTPTCSRYALDALAGHGALRGGRLALRRLLRCGRTEARLDPVPPAR